MSDRFTWTEPKLCTKSKDWFVYFNFTDHLTKKTARKQFRGGINSFKTKEERLLQGNALRAYWKQELKAGWNPFSKPDDPIITRPTIIQALDTIFHLKEASCNHKVIEKHKYILKLFKGWLHDASMQQVLVCKFDAHLARAYMDYLTVKKKYSGRTFNDHRTTLGTYMNCFIEREWISKNPFKAIKKMQVKVGRNIAFTDVERDLLRDYLYNNERELYYFTQFIYYCFIRRSELTRLKIENIDWQNMTINVPANVSKNKKQESVVIPDQFTDIVNNIGLQHYHKSSFIFGRRLKPGPVQFINYNHISTKHNEICRKLDIPEEKGLYSWKHTGVCALYRVLNGDIYGLMRQLRHSDLNTTQIYLKSLGLIDNKNVRAAVW